MVKESKNIEKTCLFFASDYHFEMISLPYINESIKNNKKVIMMTENDLNGTVDKLLANVNLEKEEKERIVGIDWKNNDINKLEQIQNANQEGKEIVVFVKGKEQYIDDINKNIKNLANINDMKIVNCYDINSIDNEVSDIAKNYSKILSTSGVEKLL